MNPETQRSKSSGFGHSRKRVFAEIGAIIGGLVIIIFGGFALAASCAGALVPYVPLSVDETLGAKAWRELAPEGRRCVDPGPEKYVESIVAPLLAELGDDRFQFQFTVVDSSDVNAFALPGGFVTVNFGLLQAVQSGEEVAGVLAHEIIHVLKRHSLTRVLRSAGGRLIVGLIIGWTDASTLSHYAGELAQRSYDREQERESDSEGRALLKRAGIDPGGMASFFQRLQERSPDGPALVSFMSTHPGHDERIAAARQDAQGFSPRLKLAPPPAELQCGSSDRAPSRGKP